MPQKKEHLKDLRTSLLSRGLSLAKATLQAGGLSASGWLNSDPKNPKWLAGVEALTNELGKLKGTAMKVGQTFSMYGEHLLPKEVNDILKKLQQNSPPLDWSKIAEVLQSELGAERLAELQIEEQAVASASIGQVHRAVVKNTGEVLAMKVQYPGVDVAVEADMKLLKFVLNMTDLVPRGPRFDQIFNEIREMFAQELDYQQELQFTDEFAAHLQNDSRYWVPKTYPRYSTRRVLSCEFIVGERPDSEKVQALSQTRRNRLGLSFLDLYLHELLDWRKMQTDPHLGNYLIHIDPNGENDRLVLLDFGAVRSVPEDFLSHYSMLIEGGLARSERLMETAGRRLQLVQPDDNLTVVKDFVTLCSLLIEPFHDPQWQSVPNELMNSEGVYDWGASDLPKRVAVMASRIAFQHKFRTPPRELVFLDRKLGGVFVFLSVLRAKIAGRPLLQQALLKFSGEPRV
jgi:predicted unusual protein kinase regulating ubiquinone biosynthesis (AarF/ABC1/UbiB family)